MKKTFYTEQFYNDPNSTLDVLNKLNNSKYVNEIDMYSSGEFLVFEVLKNKYTEKIVSNIIFDLNTYSKENKESYTYHGDEIDFSLLVEDHKNFFNQEYEIVWDHENRNFCFAESLLEEDLSI